MKKILFVSITVFMIFILISCSSAPSVKEMGKMPSSLKEIKGTEENDPSIEGTYTVMSLTYGGTSNDRRKEYSESARKITTKSVNISSFINKIDKNYWGYDVNSVPLNGIAWYPEEKGKFPLILCVHGNHSPKDYSESGYEYLGKLFASRGYIFVSVDENFINGLFNENDARAFLLLKHIETILSWNNDKDNPFFQKIDSENIGLIGHSRGGEAVVNAAIFNKLTRYPDSMNEKFNFNYNIKGVVSIAPIEGQYRPSFKKEGPKDINYLVLQGSQDGDVYFFAGQRFYNRIKFSDERFFKSSFWIYGANHAQFNSNWAKSQDPYPSLKSNLLTTEEQLKISKTLISAFFEVSFNKNQSYKEIFKDFRKGLKWLPKTFYASSYNDESEILLANYSEDLEFSTLSKNGWRADAANLKSISESMLWLIYGEQENWVNYINWDREKNNKEIGNYELFTQLNPVKSDTLIFDTLVFDTGKEESMDYSIEIRETGGATHTYLLSEHYLLKKLPKVNLFMIKEESRNIPQSIYISLGKELEIESIKFIFDKTIKGNIMLDNIRLKKAGGNK